VQWFEDRERGKHLERPAFQRMQAAIFSGSIDTVMGGINTVADWSHRGIRVVSITQQIGLNGLVGQLIAGVLFGIAQIEHQHSRERQASGIAAAKKKGIYTGRKVGATKAQPARASALRKQALTVPEIAQALGVKHRTVFNYLRKSR
jgi:DNA invertase Pin-like site-specific DNA recombinase